MATQAFMSRANSVYYGPSSTIYASVGSVGLGEQVTVYGKEKGWFFIEYSAGTLKKRGYVPYDSIQNPESINEGERYYTGKLDVTNSSTTVYTGPNSSLYATAGSVSSGESVTVYNEVIGSYTYIEYSTSTGTKRGYVLTSRLVGRNIGALAYVFGNTNVFYGPDAANYVTSGSISDSEYFIVLACEKPFGSPEKWCHVEYNTSSGRKRGYIKQDTVIPRGSLSSVSDIRVRRGNAFAIGGLTVYAGPSVYYATAGSISNGELVATLNGEQSESGYTYIEYNTSSGKKRGYVNANYLQETELFSHMMAADAKVYYGPSQKNYAEAGSVKAAEQVSVIGKEKNWFFIEYATATRIKRGYVPATTVMDASIIQQTTPERIYEGHLDMTNSGATVFTGPGEQYATAGSVAATESLTIFNEVVDGYCYVEYSTPNSTKRGYIPVGCLSGKNVGMLGKVIADTVQVYSGPDITYYRCGTVFKDEYVIILNSEGTTIYQDTWYFVEYNTPAGRKRGYVLKASIDPVSSTATLPDLAVGNGLAKALEDMNVFFCPSDQSAIVGSISEDERVSVLVSDNFNPFYSYIEYNSPSGTKRGYVPAAKLISTTVTIPQPNTTIVPVIYGTTANNNTLKYYQIGSGPKTLAVVFAVHGYEDAWAADGEELVRIANHLIEQLENEAATGDLSAWTIYIIPAANPDGITHGWTNNGPGRTTVNDKIDINRCFPTNFTPGTNRRNYTGPSSLGAYEASVLKNLISDWNLNAEYMILLDVHGWLNATYGNPTIGEYFNSQFGFGATISIDSAKGYLSRWAQAYGIKAVLIELPFPSNPQTIIDNNLQGN